MRGNVDRLCDISTHTPLAGRDLLGVDMSNIPQISTHTPLAGRDKYYAYTPCAYAISTHTPLAGRDPQQPENHRNIFNFNSHAPCGARPWLYIWGKGHSDFNSHAPCGARLVAVDEGTGSIDISTHTPLAGRDSKILYTLPSYRLNQGVDKNWGYSVSFIFSVI